MIAKLCKISLVLLSVSTAMAETPRLSWQMPITLSDTNTRIKYHYAALGEDHSGVSSGVTGQFSLSGPDVRSIHGSLTIPLPPTSQLISNDSGLGALGGLGVSLGSMQLPPATLLIDFIRGLCSPDQIDARHPCSAELEGSARFGKSPHKISIPVRVTRDQRDFILTGQQVLDTERAAQQNPIARVVESAEANFEVRIPIVAR